MTAAPKQPRMIESVQLSTDEQALLISVVDSDAEVITFAKSGGLGEDAVNGIKRVMRLGAMSASIGSAQSTIGELRRVVDQVHALEAMPGQVAAQLSTTIGTELQRVVGDDERPGALAAALNTVTADASTRLALAVKPIHEALLGSGPEALPQLLESRLAETLTREARGILARLFDTDGGSPLMTHLMNGEKAIQALRTDTTGVESRLRAQIAELAQQVAVQKAERPDPAAGGRGWEADTLDDLARVTSILGDTVEPVGTTTGHGGSQAGDHVLHVADEGADGVCVAIECRSGTTKRLTVPQLRQAVSNRDAHAGLLLAEHSAALPRDAEAAGFRVYYSERLVVIQHDRTDPAANERLGVAVQVVRLLARHNASSPGSLAERDQLRTAIAKIETALTHLRPLRAAVTGIEKETGSVNKHAAALEADIRRAVTDMAALLAA
jgi:hypothetical protein